MFGKTKIIVSIVISMINPFNAFNILKAIFSLSPSVVKIIYYFGNVIPSTPLKMHKVLFSIGCEFRRIDKTSRRS